MILRGLHGLLLALVVGTVLGTVSFYIINIIFHYFWGSPVADGNSLFWNTVGGLIFFGVPNALIGAIVGIFKIGKSKAAVIGAISGLLMIISSTIYLLTLGQNIFFQNGVFRGEELTTKGLFITAMTIAAYKVSEILTRRSNQSLLWNNNSKYESLDFS